MSARHWYSIPGEHHSPSHSRAQADSQYGLAVLDDSETMLFTEDGWITGRDANKSDVYLFAYGLNYREALKTFFTVSGPPPLIPRWSLGNWWSRYCKFEVESFTWIG
jgi:alpha-glucosidase (family GH31 glycosyl hydrolase)